ncbi:uncharacterized protein NESG_00813 [Nematocida ausubeli]|uniref:Uncharacterized protein n=1 Tax=Nematocida ausubeli (strain ATCC PRA-371 / ERTm2) TaxID=1913371 RepID=A0A086J3E4_NEMA1|nr:uncharacterized protein NESG_00813 [Nematocida ausubeli]KFG26662.1 hypothetical protein NESG_00813 [Nematocida ausubeli]
MKIYSSVIWIKAVALISVLMMNICRADMTLEEVEATLQFAIATDATPIRINPEGPLNFLRGYIYQKMDCMYNKRFFSPQIYIDYAVEEYIYDSEMKSFYIHTREEKKDRAYEALPENKMDVYAEKYHNHLIELFPSPTGDITIETRGNQSFFQFLRAKTTEKHALQILAMLLLFSEGVHIPIDVNNKKLKVYETDKKDKIYFEVDMIIPWLNRETNETKRFEQKKVKQMIKFFQKYATNQEVLSMMVDKCSYDEFATGKFLDSPKFLIQSYIFRFIRTAERATEFIQTVHTMTEKYASKTEAPSKDDCVYDRLFKPDGTEAGSDCIALMREVENVMNMHKAFPFADSTQMPAYVSVPLYNRKDKLFSTDSLKDYSNCVDCMILSLFCCLAYDPNDFTYKTDHMGNVSEELEEFFAPDENKSFDTTKAKFQREWCKVVADLDEPSIAYCTGRNELDCGLINMLMVIAEVINAPEEEKKKILRFSQCLKEKKGDIEYEILNEIKEYTKELLKRLSKTENIQVKFSELTSDNYNDERYDLSGDITITFEHNSIQNTIVLRISEGHSAINMQPTIMKFKDDRLEKTNEIADICNSGSTFVENLFSTYMGYEIRKIDTPKKSEEFMRQQVRKTVENGFADINRLLLVKKISSLEYKRQLVSCSIIYSIDKNLTPAHPIVRFTSNILGSSELGNRLIQLDMLPSIAFADLHTKNSSNPNYPNIKISEKRYIEICSNLDSFFLISYVLDCDVDILIRWLKFDINNFYTSGEIEYNPMMHPSLNKRICQQIFKDGTMKYSDEIDNIMIEKHYEEEDKTLSIIHFIWAVYLGIEETPNLELIKANLAAIREIEFISQNCVIFFGDFSILWNAIKNLRNLKDQLCREEEEISRFNFIMKKFPWFG